MSDTILSMENITKVYPNGFVANRNVSFSCKKGTIHALLGENGAGKTTLMKILFGFLIPDEGRILVKGQPVAFKDPQDAISHGVGMVHQHFMLVDELSVAENVVLGMEPLRHGLFDMNKAVSVTDELARKYNFDLNPRALVQECSVGVKQKIEILKALLRGAEILILDEPTAVLTPQETKELFVELKKLRDMGHTIVFISHKLNEVKELCDDFTVLRSGRTVAVGDTGDYTEQQLSNMMVGRNVELVVKKEKPEGGREQVVEVRSLGYTSHTGKKLLDDVSFSLHKHRILGVAGVEGNGQSQLGELMTGLRRITHGDVLVDGVSIKGKNVRSIRKAGVSNISEDRMKYGSALTMSVEENIIADRYFTGRYSKGIRLDRKAIRSDVDELIRQFKVDCPARDALAGMLSGGNIQKMIVAREFTSNSKVIVANQPTRGIDVGSTEFIRNQLIRLARGKGVAVLLISADLTEVLEVSDSIIVMSGGRITAYFEDASAVNEMELGEYMLGIKRMTDEQIGRALG